MTHRILQSVELNPTERGRRLTACVEQRGQASIDLWFEFPGDTLTRISPEPFVAALLLPSMVAGGSLEIVPPISRRFAEGLIRVQDVLLKWKPEWRRVDISHTTHDDAAPRGDRVGSFFSGGVDSLYTAMKRGPALTDLVFMRGIETVGREERAVSESIERSQRVAQQLKLPLLVGSTNIRQHFNLEWGWYHGAGLAATALALQGTFSRIFVPSTFAFNELVPWGSSPLLDELYSTDSITIVHDGSEATRAEKVRSLFAQGHPLMDSLRVCVLNDGGVGNCGRCFKCVRTMAALAAVGQLEACTAFTDEAKNNPRAWWRAMRADSLPYLDANIALLRQTGRAPHILRLAEGVAHWQRRRSAWRQLFENSMLRHALPLLRFGAIKEIRRRIKNR